MTHRWCKGLLWLMAMVHLQRQCAKSPTHLGQLALNAKTKALSLKSSLARMHGNILRTTRQGLKKTRKSLGYSIFNSSNRGRHFHLFFALSFSRSLIALIALGPVASKCVGLSDQCPTSCGRRPRHGQSGMASFATLGRSAP